MIAMSTTGEEASIMAKITNMYRLYRKQERELWSLGMEKRGII